MGEIQKEYATKGVQFLGGCFDPEARNLVNGFEQQHVKGAFPVGWDDRGAVLEYLQYSVMQNFFVPILVFVDRSGMIRAQYIGDDAFFQDPNKNIRAKLDELVKLPPVRPKIRPNAK